ADHCEFNFNGIHGKALGMGMVRQSPGGIPASAKAFGPPLFRSERRRGMGRGGSWKGVAIVNCSNAYSRLWKRLKLLDQIDNEARGSSAINHPMIVRNRQWQ